MWPRYRLPKRHGWPVQRVANHELAHASVCAAAILELCPHFDFPCRASRVARCKVREDDGRGAVLISAVRADLATVWFSLNATKGGNVSVASTIADLVSSNPRLILTPSGRRAGHFDVIVAESEATSSWSATFYSKARGAPTEGELDLANTPLPMGEINQWGSRPAGLAPTPPPSPPPVRPPGPLPPAPPCPSSIISQKTKRKSSGCYGGGGCHWPYSNATLPDPTSLANGTLSSLANETTLACEATCERLPGGCGVSRARMRSGYFCFFYEFASSIRARRSSGFFRTVGRTCRGTRTRTDTANMRGFSSGSDQYDAAL